MKMVGIYAIKNKVTNQYYVGQSIHIEKRIERHFKSLNKNLHINIHLQNSYNKYGKEQFEVLILEELERENLSERESYWVNKYKCLEEGFNILPIYGGGNENKGKTYIDIYGEERANEIKQRLSISHAGYVMSEEQKKKISESNKGRTSWNAGLDISDERVKNWRNIIKQKYESGELINPNKGKEFSTEYRQKLSNAKQGKYTGVQNPFFGKTHSEITKKKMSECRKGKPRDKQASDKVAEKLRGKKQETFICPHCNKEGGNTMFRWHFDNCKLKEK